MKANANRGRKDDPDLTYRLLDTMVQALAGAGFEAVRLEAIAQTARTSKQAVYRRWPGKEVFAVAALTQGIGRLVIPVPERSNAARDLHRMVMAYLDSLNNDVGQALVKVRACSEFDKPVREFEEDIRFHVRQCLIATPFEQDLPARATLVLGLIWQELSDRLSGRSGLDTAGLESAIYLVLGLFGPRD